MSRTINEVLERAAARWGEHEAVKAQRGGTWQTLTWSRYRSLARQVARGFMALGLGPRQGVSILGGNRPEWFLSDLGAILAGGVPAGVYQTSSPEQFQYITQHCEAAIAVIENPEQLARLESVRARLPSLRAIVLMEGHAESPGVVGWEALLERASEVTEAELQARIDAQRAEDLATLIYTSGTTGPPKAVMLSHHNITWTAEALAAQVSRWSFGPGDSVVSYLPLSHVAEQVVSLHLPMQYGGCAWCVERLERLPDVLREAQPSMFLGVPRVWEKIQAKIVATAAQGSPIKRRIGALARKVGLAGGYADQAGTRRPLLYPLAERLVFQKVRAALGLSRCRLAVTSAAPIGRDTLEFFLSLGIPICEIYGMSECTGPATISLPSRYRTGKAGFALPGVEVRIADDGEVCMRGPNVFMGYLRAPEATAETLDPEGWLHSGDVGTLDAEGFLQITDRKKELFITAGGENIAPQIIEGLLKSIPVVGQAVAVGDKRRFIAALVTLNPERVAAEARAAGLNTTDPAVLAGSAAFMAHLMAQVDVVNRRLSRAEAVKRVRILPAELTVESGELTPTMKLKRRIIAERYAAEIDRLYS